MDSSGIRVKWRWMNEKLCFRVGVLCVFYRGNIHVLLVKLRTDSPKCLLIGYSTLKTDLHFLIHSFIYYLPPYSVRLLCIKHFAKHLG